jgi:hypothetical protein
MTPDLATYQTAANAVYQPLAAADIAKAKATATTDVANQESLKGQISTDYQAAIDNLTTTTNSNVAKINQLYTQRLGGNFSGLQGNDLGSMFGKATQAQGTIESTRANKLSAISTAETNIGTTLAADISSIGSKYQSQAASSAQTNYNADVKAQQAQANSDRNYNLAVEKANISANNSNNSKADAAANKFGYTQSKASGNLFFHGAQGESVSLADYMSGTGKNGADIKNILSAGSAYDQAAYKKIKSLNSDTAILSALQAYDKNNFYGFNNGVN